MIRLFDEETKTKICEDYKNMTRQELADKYYCSTGTISNVLNEKNITKYNHRRKYNYAMVVNDYKAGIHADDIAKKYQMPSRNIVYYITAKARKNGSSIKRHRSIKKLGLKI